MKVKISLLLFLCVIPAILVWGVRNQTLLFEKTLNQAAGESFANSIRLSSAGLDSRLHFRIDGFQGIMSLPEGPYPVEISTIKSENSIANLLWKKPVFFIFDGIRFYDSAFKGLRGKAEVRSDGFLRVESDIEGLGLEDIAPLNPENLKGASGEMEGRMILETAPGREPVFELALHGKKTGGKIPSRFLEAFVPYLPKVKNSDQLEAIIRISGLVAFNEADLKLSSAGPGRMKVFLHMRIPDYNFILNLNVEIRVDEENFFQMISDWVGKI